MNFAKYFFFPFKAKVKFEMDSFDFHSIFFFKHDENFTDAFQNAVHQHRRPTGAGTVWDLSESPWPAGDTGRGQLHRPPHSTGAHQERLCHVGQGFHSHTYIWRRQLTSFHFLFLGGNAVSFIIVLNRCSVFRCKGYLWLQNHISINLC